MFSYWKWLDIDKGGISNEFGEIQHEYRINMMNFWDVSVVDHTSWRVVLVGLHSWDSNRHKSMANLISRHFLDCQLLDQWKTVCNINYLENLVRVIQRFTPPSIHSRADVIYNINFKRWNTLGTNMGIVFKNPVKTLGMQWMIRDGRKLEAKVFFLLRLTLTVSFTIEITMMITAGNHHFRFVAAD